ncbi:hypothetical protein ILUMI_24371 [Ignelater luminosus]|uniref:Uncharacterized protein n=1 Tax=Ignelater luminosus TaxID=2038154 RepID=A0A8K0CDK8_IGNLU|nr:hypothetical protein ILUMI_24371 [Ignelater luminosus]
MIKSQTEIDNARLAKKRNEENEYEQRESRRDIELLKQEIMRKLEKEAGNSDLEINQKKTKYMVVGNTGGDDKNQVQLTSQAGKEHKSEKVKHFVYLRVTLAKSGKEDL